MATDAQQTIDPAFAPPGRLVADEVKVRGFPFPINPNAGRGTYAAAVDEELIKSDLIQLIMTEPGERVMMPFFGTGLRRMIFEPNDASVEAEARDAIIQAIDRWEPRIVVHEVTVRNGSGDDRLNVPGDNIDGSSLTIHIAFSLKENLDDFAELDFKANFDKSKILEK